MILDFDNLIVLSFLIITFLVGMSHGRGMKTMQDYALGGRNFSTSAIVATLVASWLGGSSFFIHLSKIYSDGLYFLFASVSTAISFFLIAYIVVPRMGEFLGNNSIAESMGSIYGNNVRIITAITGILASTGFIAVQFQVFGKLFAYSLGIPPSESIILSAFIVIAYSASGGIRAVTFTDMVQIMTFSIAIPTIGVMIWSHLYHAEISFENSLSINQFNVFEVFNIRNPKFLEMLPLILYFVFAGLTPPIYQRILIGSNLKQVKKAFILSGSLIIMIKLMMSGIPFLIFNIDNTLDNNQLSTYIIDNYAYVGIKGLLISGVFAMAMSTADSEINSASVLFANDICTKFNLTTKKRLTFSKVFAIFVGTFGVMLALSEQDLLSIVLKASSFYMPVVTTPLLLTILGFRSSSKSVLIGMVTGIFTIAIWQVLQIQMNGIVFAMFMNLIFLLGSHYLLKQPGGWVGIKGKKEFEELKQAELKEKMEYTKEIGNRTIVNYCRKKFPTNVGSYVLLGLYLILYSITVMYLTKDQILLEEASNIILGVYQVILISGTVFFIYPIWPKSIKDEHKILFAQLLWPIVIFCSLICLNTFFLLVGDFQNIYFAIFVMNLIFAATLLGWRVFIMLAVFGIFVGFKLHEFYNPSYVINTEIGSPVFLASYSFMMVAASVIIFLKPKQEEQDRAYVTIVNLKKQAEYAKREFENLSQGLDFLDRAFKEKEGSLKAKEGSLKAKEVFLKGKLKLMRNEVHKAQAMKEEFLRNIPHETNTPLTAIISLSDVLYSCYDSLDNEKIKQTLKNIIQGGDRLKSYVYNIADLSKLSSISYDLNLKKVNLSKLIKERVHLYKKTFSDEIKQEFVLEIEDDLELQCDEYYITQVIDNLITNAVEYGKGNPVKILLSKKQEQNGIEFKIIDRGIGIPEDELIKIFDNFTVSSKTSTIAGGRGVGLALCSAITKAHKGRIWAESDGETGSTFTFIVPMDNYRKLN